MARSIYTLWDLPVSTERGVRMGTVQDVLVDLAEQRVAALAIAWDDRPTDLQGPEDVVPLLAIRRLDKDMLIVSNEIEATAGMEAPITPSPIAVRPLVGCPVKSDRGEALGVLADVFFDPRDGAVVAYEISDNGSERGEKPTRLLPPSTHLTVTADAIVVPHRLALERVSAEALGDITGEDMDDQRTVQPAPPESGWD